VAREHQPLWPVRNRHRRLRPGRGAGVRHCTEAPLRPAAHLGRYPHRRRHGGAPLLDTFGNPRPGSLRPGPHHADRERDDPGDLSRQARLGGVFSGFVPTLPDAGALYIGLGMLGATSCPTTCTSTPPWCRRRKVGSDPARKRQAIRLNNLDSAVALNMAFFVNAAILILAAATFYRAGHRRSRRSGCLLSPRPASRASIAPVALP